MDNDYEYGCTCPTGHPPCSFCVSLTEEEAEIHAQYGSRAVYRFREGNLPEPVRLEQHYSHVKGYGEF